MFTAEQPVDTYVETVLGDDQLAFDGFTMVGQSALAEAMEKENA